MLLAFTGLKRSGKDTAVDFLVSRCNWLQKVRFADSIKNMIRTLMLSRGAKEWELDSYIEGDLKESPNPYLSGQTTRWAMQSLGTEWGRKLMGDNFWLDSLSDQIKMLSYINKSPIIPDVRFHNEVEFVKQNNGILIKISRPGFDEPADHESERYIAEIKGNINIINNGSIENLYSILLRELREWL